MNKVVKYISMKSVLIFLFIVLMIGISYAVFNYTYIGNVNHIEKHSIDLQFLESRKTINLENVLPMSDEKGIEQEEAFEFQVRTKTKGNMSIGYELIIEKLEVNEGYTSFNDDQIKIYLTDDKDVPLMDPCLISELDEYKLYKKYHVHNNSTEEIVSRFKIRVWVDFEVDSTNWNENTKLEYSFKINIQSSNEKTYKVVFNSNNKENKNIVQYMGYDELLKLEKNNFANAGYKFEGWSLTQAGRILYDDNEKVMNISGEEEEITLYAQWQNEKSYKGYEIYDMLEEDAVSDNVASEYVTSSNGIDISKPSSITNGKGIYKIASTQNDEYPIYYYRGGVNSNNIVLNDYCWKILRTTETGGVKLIFNGPKLQDETCNASESDTLLYSKKSFNGTGIGIAGAGYSYTEKTRLKLTAKNDSTMTEGIIFANDVTYDQTTKLYTLNNNRYVATTNFNAEKYDKLKEHHYSCLKTTDEGCSSVYYFYMGRDAQTFYATLTEGQKISDLLNLEFEGNSTNVEKSNVHSLLETWYEEKMLGVDQYLEDTIFCNDRSLYNKWTTNSSIANDNDLKLQFGAKARVAYTHDVTVKCKYKADSFTKSTSLGNGKLKHPVGLITFDEAALAGMAWDVSDTSSYLHNGKVWWTMSPGFVSATGVYIGVVHSMLDHVAVNYTSSNAGGIRPVISLKQGMKIEDGAGTAKNPFTIENVEN